MNMGKKTSRILIIAAAVFGMTALFGACSKSDAEQTGPVTISFWHSMTDDAGLLFETFVKEFNEGPGAEKQITVEAVFQGQYADATSKLRPLLQTGQTAALPDVMQVDATGVMDYLNTEYAYTVDDVLRTDTSYNINQIMTAPLRAWNYEGRQLGLPVSASTTVMFYNKTILEAAGFTSPPTTFAEIIEVAKKLPALNSNGQKLTAFAQQPNTPSLANWIGQIPGGTASSSYVVDNRNGRDGNAARLVCDTEGTLLAFLREWKAMYDSGALLDVSSGLNNLFLSEQIVFLTASTSQLTPLLNQIDGRFELGCAYFPRINSLAKFGATVSGSAVFMFNKGNSAKTQAAWEFVKYLTSPDIQARFSIGTGYMPVNNGSFDTEAYKSYSASYPQAEIGARQLAETSPDMMGVIVGPAQNFYYEIMNQSSAMLTEKKTPEEAVNSMAAALNLLLDDYNAAQGN